MARFYAIGIADKLDIRLQIVCACTDSAPEEKRIRLERKVDEQSLVHADSLVERLHKHV